MILCCKVSLLHIIQFYSIRNALQNYYLIFSLDVFFKNNFVADVKLLILINLKNCLNHSLASYMKRANVHCETNLIRVSFLGRNT